MESEEQIIRDLLQSADIHVNGCRSGDIQVHNKHFYRRALHDGALGLGESYMDGWWDCEQLDIFFEKILRANLGDKIKKSKRLIMKILLSKLINFQSKMRALEVGKKHYDLDQTLFQNMLDSRMNYTCGYWKDAQNLEEAQLAKLELTCQKLLLKPGMTLLDIGCGWGGLAKYAAENYGVSVVGITISKHQSESAKQICKGLPIDIRFQDYRDVKEKFDRISSLGMFEHVGPANYTQFMQIVQSCLKDNGIFLLHTIGKNIMEGANEWIDKYIFPNGVLPTIALIAKAMENLFIMEDWHNFGADYDKTLMAWQHNVEKNWGQLQSTYDERFHRMWNYYLLSCAGGFRVRQMQLWQIVFSKEGIRGGYQAPRSVQPIDQAYLNYAKHH